MSKTRDFDLSTVQRATREQLRTARELLDIVHKLRNARSHAPGDTSQEIELIEKDLVRAADRLVDTAGDVHSQLRNVVGA